MSPQDPPSPETGPAIIPEFAQQLDRLVALARKGHRPGSPLNNPSEEWLAGQMRVLQDLPSDQQDRLLAEAREIGREAAAANAEGKAAVRAWPDVAVRLDTKGLGFFSQLGVVRRPDLTKYFIDGFTPNRDALAFSEDDQALFAEVFGYINEYLERRLESGEDVIQSDRQIGDAPGRSYHARQLLFGVRYLQIPLMWRQLTFDLPGARSREAPDIMEVSIPHWLDDLGMPQDLKDRLQAAGMTQLVFKAPTKGLSLHLGFDYVGEHKMGPLSVAMFLVKQKKGLAIQGAVSLARAKTIHGPGKTTALVTIGPSLHGKSTLTIMLELANTELTPLLGLEPGPDEGVYPMNDDIVLLQPLDWPIQTTIRGRHVTIPYGIDGTENNFYAMPSGLNVEDDPITFEAVRGTKEAPNSEEALENVPVVSNEGSWEPDFFSNPVRNMRVTLSRSRLITRKGTRGVIEAITGVRGRDPVHVPMEHHRQGVLAGGHAPEHGHSAAAAGVVEAVHPDTHVRGSGADGGGRRGDRQALRGVFLRPVHHRAGGRQRKPDVPRAAGTGTRGDAPGVLRIQHRRSGSGQQRRGQRAAVQEGSQGADPDAAGGAAAGGGEVRARPDIGVGRGGGHRGRQRARSGGPAAGVAAQGHIRGTRLRTAHGGVEPAALLRQRRPRQGGDPALHKGGQRAVRTE